MEGHNKRTKQCTLGTFVKRIKSSCQSESVSSEQITEVEHTSNSEADKCENFTATSTSTPKKCAATAASIDVDLDNHQKQEQFSRTNYNAKAVTKYQLPKCWSMEQFTYFSDKYPWLFVLSNRLGCQLCNQIGTLGIEQERSCHIASDWKLGKVTFNGSNVSANQSSLRKKLFEHSNSKSHHKAESIIKTSQSNLISKSVDKLNAKALQTSERIFNIVYSLAKRNRPLSDITNEVELQVKNGVDLGLSLHSRGTAVNIVQHIATEMRKTVFSKIIAQKGKLCIILDEATTCSKLAVLVIYLRCELTTVAYPVNMFVDLQELISSDAENIVKVLLQCLDGYGFTSSYLKNNLIGICSDGASVMLGSKSGVGVRMVELFPGILLWHCLNHRIQLALGDAIDSVSQVNHCKIFLEKLHCFYSQSTKNQRELNDMASDLGLEIQKIGRVFGPRWAACSLRATKAVWKSYPVLYKHFKAKSDAEAKGIVKRLEKRSFIIDLSIIIDILQELAYLSEGLQRRSITLSDADRLINLTLRALERNKDQKGNYEVSVPQLLLSGTYDFIQNDATCSLKNRSLPREQLYQSVIDNLRQRLTCTVHCKQMTNSDKHESVENYKELLSLFDLLDDSKWVDISVPWFEGERKLPMLSKQIKFDVPVVDFRDFVESKTRKLNRGIPESIVRAKRICSTIAVSSSEAERGFSVMNCICTDYRGSLLVENISNLMFIKIVGKPVNDFNATPFVKSWLNSHHRSADSAQIKNAVKHEYSDNEKAIWELL